MADTRQKVGLVYIFLALADSANQDLGLLPCDLLFSILKVDGSVPIPIQAIAVSKN